MDVAMVSLRVCTEFISMSPGHQLYEGVYFDGFDSSIRENKSHWNIPQSNNRVENTDKEDKLPLLPCIDL